MTYRVKTDSIAPEIRRFTPDIEHWWNVCIAEIALNPFPRSGAYIERIAPIRGLPMRTYLYDIVEDARVSGEIVHAFTAEFFPWYIVVYVLYEDDHEVDVIFLRENHLV